MVGRVVRAPYSAPNLAEERRNGWKAPRAVFAAARGSADQWADDTDRPVGERLDQGDERIRAKLEVGIRNAKKRRLALGERGVVVGAESFRSYIADDLDGPGHVAGEERLWIICIQRDENGCAICAETTNVLEQLIKQPGLARADDRKRNVALGH